MDIRKGFFYEEGYILHIRLIAEVINIRSGRYPAAARFESSVLIESKQIAKTKIKRSSHIILLIKNILSPALKHSLVTPVSFSYQSIRSLVKFDHNFETSVKKLKSTAAKEKGATISFHAIRMQVI